MSGTTTTTMPSTAADNFNSRGPKDLANFVQRIYPPTGNNLKARLLSFHLPYDSLISSGIVEELLRAPIRVVEDVGDAAILDNDHRPTVNPHANQAAAANMLRALFESHVVAVNIPLKDVFSVYVLLLSVCTDVETIEIPGEWKDDFTWQDGYFPKVDKNSKRTLADGRVRWGPEYVENLPESNISEELLVERSMGLDGASS